MNTTIISGAQYLNPKNITEALRVIEKPGEVTAIVDEHFKSLSTHLANHWLSGPEKVTTVLEGQAPELCLKILMAVQMPHIFLPLAEPLLYTAFAGYLSSLRAPAGHFGAAPLDVQAIGSIKPLCGSQGHSSMRIEVLEREIELATDCMVRFLKQGGIHKHKLQMGYNRWTYSPDLRLRFWALTAYADALGSSLQFVTVTLSRELNQKLVTDQNKRSIEQKINYALKRIKGNRMAGFCVIEPSRSSKNRFHLHMVVAGADLNDDVVNRFKSVLKTLSDPEIKTAIQVTKSRKLKCVPRPGETYDKYGFTARKIEGIDMGVTDYSSKDLNSNLMIGTHKQVFGINNDQYYKKSVANKLQAFTEDLRQRALKYVQPDDLVRGREKIKSCMLRLFFNIITRKYMHENVLTV